MPEATQPRGSRAPLGVSLACQFRICSVSNLGPTQRPTRHLAPGPHATNGLTTCQVPQVRNLRVTLSPLLSPPPHSKNVSEQSHFSPARLQRGLKHCHLLSSPAWTIAVTSCPHPSLPQSLLHTAAEGPFKNIRQIRGQWSIVVPVFSVCCGDKMNEPVPVPGPSRSEGPWVVAFPAVALVS